MSRNNPLWPSEQLLLTADTRESRECSIEPLMSIESSSGNCRDFSDRTFLRIPWCIQLQKTTRDGTAFRMGVNGHVSYHHWDRSFTESFAA